MNLTAITYFGKQSPQTIPREINDRQKHIQREGLTVKVGDAIELFDKIIGT